MAKKKTSPYWEIFSDVVMTNLLCNKLFWIVNLAIVIIQYAQISDIPIYLLPFEVRSVFGDDFVILRLAKCCTPLYTSLNRYRLFFLKSYYYDFAIYVSRPGRLD